MTKPRPAASSSASAPAATSEARPGMRDTRLWWLLRQGWLAWCEPQVTASG